MDILSLQNPRIACACVNVLMVNFAILCDRKKLRRTHVARSFCNKRRRRSPRGKGAPEPANLASYCWMHCRTGTSYPSAWSLIVLPYIIWSLRHGARHFDRKTMGALFLAERFFDWIVYTQASSVLSCTCSKWEIKFSVYWSTGYMGKLHIHKFG